MRIGHVRSAILAKWLVVLQTATVAFRSTVKAASLQSKIMHCGPLTLLNAPNEQLKVRKTDSLTVRETMQLSFLSSRWCALERAKGVHDPITQ